MATAEDLELEADIPVHIKEEEWIRVQTYLMDYFQLSRAIIDGTNYSRRKKEENLSHKFATMFEITDVLTNSLSLATFRSVTDFIQQKFNKRVQGLSDSYGRGSSSGSSGNNSNSSANGGGKQRYTRNVIYNAVDTVDTNNLSSESTLLPSLQVQQLEQEAIDAWDLLECLMYNNGLRVHSCVSTYTFQHSVRELVEFYVTNRGKTHPFTAKLLLMVKHYSDCFAPKRNQYHAIVDLQTLLERGSATCPGISFRDVDTRTKAPIFPRSTNTTFTSCGSVVEKPPKTLKPNIVLMQQEETATPPASADADLLQLDWSDNITATATGGITMSSSSSSSSSSSGITASIDPFAPRAAAVNNNQPRALELDLAAVFSPNNPFTDQQRPLPSSSSQSLFYNHQQQQQHQHQAPPIPSFPPPLQEEETMTNMEMIPFTPSVSTARACTPTQQTPRVPLLPPPPQSQSQNLGLGARGGGQGLQKRGRAQMAPSPIRTSGSLFQTSASPTIALSTPPSSEPFAECVPSWFTIPSERQIERDRLHLGPCADASTSTSDRDRDRDRTMDRVRLATNPSSLTELQEKQQKLQLLQLQLQHQHQAQVQAQAQAQPWMLYQPQLPGILTPAPSSNTQLSQPHVVEQSPSAMLQQAQHYHEGSDAGTSTALVAHNFWTLPPLPSQCNYPQQSYAIGGNAGSGSQNAIDRAYDQAQMQQYAHSRSYAHLSEHRHSDNSYQPAVPDTPLSRMNWKYRPPLKSLVKRGKQSL